jgi:hypothetical protein
MTYFSPYLTVSPLGNVTAVEKGFTEETENPGTLLRIASGFNTDLDADPLFSVNVDPVTQQFEHFAAQKMHIYLIENCNIFIPRPPWRTSKLEEKSLALKGKHP